MIVLQSKSAIRSALLLSIGFLVSYAGCFGQKIASRPAENPIEAFFDQLPGYEGNDQSRSETPFYTLASTLGVLSSNEIVNAMPIIDRQFDRGSSPDDRLAQFYAANLLMFISSRPDGASLLAPELSRLAAILNDPYHRQSGKALIALYRTGSTRPDVVGPILSAALKDAHVNQNGGVGPGIAEIMARLAPTNVQVDQEVAHYMGRPDTTDNDLISTLIGLRNANVKSDVLTLEFVRCLDRHNEQVRIKAIIAITSSKPSAAKDLGRAKMLAISQNLSETPRIRSIAEQALEGKVVEGLD